MRTISINENNDISKNRSNNLAIDTDIQAVADVIKNRVLTLLQELSLNTEKGIPYYTTVWAEQANLELFQANVVNEIETTPGVIRCKDFNYKVNDGVLSYTAEIETEYGTVILNG